jgi:hypothetical protein
MDTDNTYNALPPSTQKVSLVEQELIDCIRKKREMDRILLDLEVQLYNYETSFLERYAQAGSIVKGFDPSTFLSLLVSPDRTGGNKELPESDRLFSSSSMTTQKALQIKQKLGIISPIPTNSARYTNMEGAKGPTRFSSNSRKVSKREEFGEEEEEDDIGEEDEPYHEYKGARLGTSLPKRKRPVLKKGRKDRNR